MAFNAAKKCGEIGGVAAGGGVAGIGLGGWPSANSMA